MFFSYFPPRLFWMRSDKQNKHPFPFTGQMPISVCLLLHSTLQQLNSAFRPYLHHAYTGRYQYRFTLRQRACHTAVGYQRGPSAYAHIHYKVVQLRLQFAQVALCFPEVIVIDAVRKSDGCCIIQTEHGRIICVSIQMSVQGFRSCQGGS